MFFYTYVLECRLGNTKSYYIGYCSDIEERIRQHKNGEVFFTKKYESIKLVYYEACTSKTDAIKRELQLKTGFGRGYIKKRLDSYLASRD